MPTDPAVGPPFDCDVCGEPKIITVNATGVAVGACSAHFYEVMDEQATLLATERGIPVDVARKLMAKAVRGVLGYG